MLGRGSPNSAGVSDQLSWVDSRENFAKIHWNRFYWEKIIEHSRFDIWLHHDEWFSLQFYENIQKLISEPTLMAFYLLLLQSGGEGRFADGRDSSSVESSVCSISNE